MDYAKLSEESLDEIMRKIRVANGMILDTEEKLTNMQAEEISWGINNNNLNVIDKYLTEAVLGKRIGLHKAPMNRKKGIARVLARIIEKCYLRVAELTNRDIREFNGTVISLFHAFKREIVSINKKVKDDLNINKEYCEKKFEEFSGELEEAIESKISKIQEEANSKISEMENILKERTSLVVEKNNKNELLIRELNEEIIALKSIVKWVNNNEFTKSVEEKVGTKVFDNPIFYHDFEEEFRGTQDDIRERLTVYLDKLNNHFGNWTNKKFIDIGCGRGEWLDLIKQSGVNDYIGIDLNSVQLGICEEKGHSVKKMDCVKYISGIEDNSVDVITGFQLIEHLPLEVFLVLLSECKRVLRKDGIILFETPNSSNIVTASTYFYMDPSHTRPIHKDVARFLVQKSGFSEVEILEVNPARYSQTFVKPTCFDGNQDIWDLNVNLLNSLVYGPQDYAVVGVKYE